MGFKIYEMKEAVYLCMAVLGLICLVAAAICAAAGSSTFILTSIILAATGAVFLLFVLVTFLIRDDPEVWS